MKICPRLIISDCTLRVFRGYDFRIFKILLFLDRYFGVFDSDLRASPPPPPPPRMFSYGVPLRAIIRKRRAISFPRGHTSISLTGMLVREQILTTQKNRMTLNSNLKKIECPKIQPQQNRMTQDVMLLKV